MAPLTRRRKRALDAAAAPRVIHPADRLSRLPDEVLAHILSFLPAQEAVRTCVLARTWRDVWKFTRRLRITGGTVEDVQVFVDRLLHLRLNGLNGLKCASLEECEIKFRMVEDDADSVNRWIRTSLKCQVQTLRVLNGVLNVENGFVAFEMINSPLISQHLTRLELRGLWFQCVDLNMDGCPVLERLEIKGCHMASVRKIMSPSIKRLVITDCFSHWHSQLFKISAPCLVSLWLDVGEFRAPLLERMPELVEAYVRVDSYRENNCSCDHPMGCYHVMQPSYSSDGESTEGCVLLEGLSQAKHLVLLAHHSTYIFRRDLRLCPTFSNLKALVLNGYWCEPTDCPALACILEHAPVLENLAVVFSKEVELEYDIVWEGCLEATGESTMRTQCLKTVKVKCHVIDEGVQNVLKFLGALNICFNSE